MTAPPAVDESTVAAVVRAETSHCIATLVRHLGDVGLAEDAVAASLDA